MRCLSVSGPYAQYLEGRIASLVDECRQDEYRRAHGHKPIIDDLALQPGRPDPAFVVVGVAGSQLVEGIRQAIEKSDESRARATKASA